MLLDNQYQVNNVLEGGFSTIPHEENTALNIFIASLTTFFIWQNLQSSCFYVLTLINNQY